MAFDISKITSAVNSYLYSISDVNKLLSDNESAESSAGLSGIFQKLLTKAVSDETAKQISDDEAVTKALSALSGITTGQSVDSAFDAYADENLFSYTLPDLTSKSSAGTVATSDNGNTAKSVTSVYSKDVLASQIQSRFDSLDIAGEIQKSIESHNRLNEISSYNANRLKTYNTQSDNTSVFGDFYL
nr:hypothetical protein [uncultured Butyrivibrio sp.]